MGDKFNALASSSTASMNGLNSTTYFDLNNTTISNWPGAGSVNDRSAFFNTTLTVATANKSGLASTGPNTSTSIYVPQIRSKNSGEYVGLLEWKIEDEAKIVAKLIDGSLSPITNE